MAPEKLNPARSDPGASPGPSCDSRRPRAGDYLIASRRCELHNLERFLRMGKLVLGTGNLIHRLQRERGASNVFLGSGGTRFADELGAMIADSDRQYVAFEQELAELHTELTDRPVSAVLLNTLAAALHGLDSLPGLRRQVALASVPAEAVIQGYTDCIGHLLRLVFDAAETVIDPAITGTVVAMVNLMQGKELAGQERAWGSLGFARGSFSPALSTRITHLIDAQEEAFGVFLRLADADLVACWRRHHHDSWQDMRRLRELACGAGRQAPAPGLADEWFALTSRRIDQLKELEDTLEAHFHRTCVQRYTEVRHALAHEEALVNSLDSEGYGPAPVQVLGGPGEDSAVVPGTGLRLGRSLMELVQQQTRRLEQVNQELTQAREALDDRRAIEKAAAALMQHQQIGESDAHRLLRKLAMDQSRKLADVARQLLSMTEVLR